jgi:hypothetical protein
MRKELEAIREVRSLIARRARTLETDYVFDLVREVEAGLMVAARLVSVGLIEPSDWEMADVVGVESQSLDRTVRLVEAKIRASVWGRLKVLQPPLDAVSLERTDPMINDLVCFIFEIAAYRRVYGTLAGGVLDCLPKYLKMRQYPKPDLAERAERLSYRSDDPEYVLDKYLAILKMAKSRVSWARSRLRRDRYLASVETKAKVPRASKGRKKVEKVDEAGSDRITVRGIIRLFQDPNVEKGLAKLRRPPDLLREAGIEDQPSPAAD